MEINQFDRQQLLQQRRWRRFIWQACPSWLISLTVHVIIIVILAMVSVEPISEIVQILQSDSDGIGQDIGEFQLDGSESMIDQDDTLEQPAALAALTESPVFDLPQEMPSDAVTSQSTPTNSFDALNDTLVDRKMLSMTSSSVAGLLSSRSAESKAEMLQRYGGNSSSERAVALALKWIAAHQLTRGPKTGAWSFDHRLATRQPTTGQGEFADSTNAATALAILPFLGAGQTHVKGQYKQGIKTGLASLISNMRLSKTPKLATGSWHELQGNMYSHGLATICVCEAYTMTQDAELYQPAQLAINYIVTAQEPRGGGWRYEPLQAGDTSVLGWCIMGLKSGRMGGLVVPDSTFSQANLFLDFVSTDKGAFYGYTRPGGDHRASMTSVGLLCRMYLGWPKDHPGLDAGTEFLDTTGPDLKDLYYTYYATQVMRHYGGPRWNRWNQRLRDSLIELQIKEGPDAGSWDPQGPHSNHGGRLYQTALATMILEVYYRHMPLYGEKSLEEDFEL